MLDHILAALLLLVVPIRALWHSRPGRISTRTKIVRYWITISLAAGLLAVLTIEWLTSGRAAGALGLAAPTSAPALIGLGITTALLATLGWSIGRKSAPSPPRPHVQDAQRQIFPETRGEAKLFLLVSLCIGCGWEILYRGFLLLYLQPFVGPWGAIAAAALAYGAAHGFQTPLQFAGSIVSALAFTVAYALTANLWWLMVLHTGMMQLGARASMSSYRDGSPTS